MHQSLLYKREKNNRDPIPRVAQQAQARARARAHNGSCSVQWCHGGRGNNAPGTINNCCALVLTLSSEIKCTHHGGTGPSTNLPTPCDWVSFRSTNSTALVTAEIIANKRQLTDCSRSYTIDLKDHLVAFVSGDLKCFAENTRPTTDADF